jgi:GntR family transcriptional regulator
LEASAARPVGRAIPHGSGEESAYCQVADHFRAAITAGRYPAGTKLPTEAELVIATGWSRQTIRRAFHELVSEGLIYRVRGRGTFAVPGEGKYLRSFGSIDDLMALEVDTEMQIVEPLHVLASIAVADRLQPGKDSVMSMSFLRLHAGVPFCCTQVHVPMEIGRRLRALPEVARLDEPGTRAAFTMISLVNRVSDRPVYSAEQDITAAAATADVARRLNCDVGSPVLRIDRLYRDSSLAALELAVNHFRPERYSYRLKLRGRMGCPGTDEAGAPSAPHPSPEGPFGAG